MDINKKIQDRTVELREIQEQEAYHRNEMNRHYEYSLKLMGAINMLNEIKKEEEKDG